MTKLELAAQTAGTGRGAMPEASGTQVQKGHRGLSDCSCQRRGCRAFAAVG